VRAPGPARRPAPRRATSTSSSFPPPRESARSTPYRSNLVDEPPAGNSVRAVRGLAAWAQEEGPLDGRSAWA
jgi:hypothetical protein